MTLQIEGLTKRFGAHTLFRGLELRVEGPAVLWAPSGWGKTTLLRILMGLERPDAGSVTGVGRVAAVFQEDRLCPQLTAVENVLLVLPDGRARRGGVEADFARLGMTGDALTLPVARLSGGQKRRAALLRAVWARADTRLFDEPFTGLDGENRSRAIECVREAARDKTVLLVTHEGRDAEDLAAPVVSL